MDHLDTFNTSDSEKVEKILAKLKENYPDIHWQTKWYDSVDINGNSTSYISLTVPASQSEEAEQMYQLLKSEGVNFDSSIFYPLIEEIVDFRDERGWKKFHNPKDLAISLSLEVNELLENFQWKTSEEAVKENIDNIKDELADVVIYALLMSNELDINLEQVVKDKIRKNRQKYPIDKAYGINKKYTKF